MELDAAHKIKAPSPLSTIFRRYLVLTSRAAMKIQSARDVSTNTILDGNNKLRGGSIPIILHHGMDSSEGVVVQEGV
jgi:hypothetical protein